MRVNAAAHVFNALAVPCGKDEAKARRTTESVSFNMLSRFCRGAMMKPNNDPSTPDAGGDSSITALCAMTQAMCLVASPLADSSNPVVLHIANWFGTMTVLLAAATSARSDAAAVLPQVRGQMLRPGRILPTVRPAPTVRTGRISPTVQAGRKLTNAQPEHACRGWVHL